MVHHQHDVIRRYLQDALAAEQSFENQLKQFAEDSQQPELQQLFRQHADETRWQAERLKGRLEVLGGAPSGVKGFMANLFSLGPKVAQMGHDPSEKGVQNLIAAIAVEHSELAMYEALAQVAAAAGDLETEQLARDIQQQEARAAEMLWPYVGRTAREAFQQVAMTSG